VQVDPIKPTLKASGTQRLTLKSDKPLSNVAFRFNLRRYNKAGALAAAADAAAAEQSHALASQHAELQEEKAAALSAAAGDNGEAMQHLEATIRQVGSHAETSESMRRPVRRR